MPIILITGSGKRIGKGLTFRFAEKGWDVIIHYNSSEKGAMNLKDNIEALGRKSYLIKSDITDYDQVKEAFGNAFEQFGIPDVLINNSGVFPDKTNLSEITTELWESTMNINLRGILYTSQIYSEYKKKGSRIVNIASLGGLEIWKNRIPYNISKSGAIQLTKALARELAPDIAVNCICPGSILVDEEPSITDTTLIDIKKIPMGRLGCVDDVFDAAWFFANCSSYITGQVITVDGGYHLAGHLLSD